LAWDQFLSRGLSREKLGFGRKKNTLAQESAVNKHSERRAMRRFNMRLPASVRVPGIPCEFSTETENVSARGIFFYLDRWLSKGAKVEVTMCFPPQVTMTEPLNVRFVARVVRVEPESATRTGVAAMIEEYEFLRPDGVPQESAEPLPNWNLST
jgi:hypothetical protein